MSLRGIAHRAHEDSNLKMLAKLKQQAFALAAAIEVKNVALDGVISAGEGDDEEAWYPSIAKAAKARTIQPSPDLLAKRDQRRDAALLRSLAWAVKTKHMNFQGDNWYSENCVNALAKARESGEWNPELEVK